MLLFLILNLASVSGYVRDSKTNEPLPYVMVYLKEINKGSFTDDKGFYVISKIPEGEYTICFKIVGYKERCEKIKVKKSESKILNVFLNRSEIEVEKIIVYARKKEFEEEAVSSLKMETGAFKFAPKFLEGDLLRTIGTLPGVIQVADISGRVSVRGGSPQENLTLIDGIPLYNPYHLGGIFSVFDLSAISKYEFFRGAYPAEYGGVLSSLLYAEIKSGNKEKIKNEISVGAISAHFLTEGPLLKGNFLVSARRTYFDKFLPVINKDYKFPYHFWDILSSYQITISPSYRIKISYVISRDLFNDKENDIFLKWGNDGFSFRNFLINKNNLHEFTFFVSSFWSLLRIDDWIKLWNPVTISGFRWKGDFKGSFDKILGIEYYHYDGKFDNDILGIKQIDKGSPHQFISFVDFNFKIKRLRIRPGLRLSYFYLRIKERPDRNTENFRVEPRLNLKYFLKENLALKLGWGIYNQHLIATSYSEIFSSFYYWLTVFNGWKPMNAYHYVTGISYLPEWGGFDFEIFYKKYNYILDYEFENYDPLNPDKTLFLEGRGESYGFDTFIEKTFGKLRGNLTLTVLKVIGRFDDESAFHPLRWDKTFNFSFNVFYRIFWGIETGLRFVYTTGDPYTGVAGRYRFFYPPIPGHYSDEHWEEIESSPYSLRFPPYHRFDISFTRNFSIKGIKGEFSLNIINVYNRKNVLMYYYDYDTEPPQRKTIYQLPIVPSFEIRIYF